MMKESHMKMVSAELLSLSGKVFLWGFSDFREAFFLFENANERLINYQAYLHNYYTAPQRPEAVNLPWTRTEILTIFYTKTQFVSMLLRISHISKQSSRALSVSLK